ncbi:hypothetical protein I5M32_15210 [Pedobacter sp. SD-b]|uniref:DUF5723 domain-containing protein n=1 Tax=Pedobacter segetis TaxID=2793069 RepID=A0ABS1BN41_9SPHI|nr:hypothetical protein [Pedobacter segetis]MBK0384315.1 hypothetical protein [Pedobacter segetis]
MKPFCVALLMLIIAIFCARSSKAQDLGNIKNQKPFTFNGNLGIGLGTYHANGIMARQRDFSYIFNGSPNLSIFGISFPFSVVISDQQKSYTQPFNQYGISPTYKWATLHAGWQSITFSPFTLAGHNFLGGGIELNPGKLRFGFVYGRFNKAIEANNQQPLAFTQEPTYERKGYSAKLGLGTDRNHVDVVFLKAKDDIFSLTKTPPSITLTPADNMVLGLSSRFSFYKYFALDIDAAGSIYTRNVLSDTVSNLKLGKYSFIRDLITLNSSTQLLTAGQISFGYQKPNYNIKLHYRRVDPDYKSMGAYYFETDVQNYTLEGMYRLIKGQLQIGGSFGLQNDNLLKDKSYQSNRKIGAINISFNNPKYGMDVRYTNYGITQDRGLNPIVDQFRVARTNHNLSTVLRFNINKEEISQGFILVGSLANLVDLNRFTSKQSQSNSKTANFSYQLNFPKRYLGINVNANYTVADFFGGNSTFYGPTLAINQSFFKGGLALGTSFSYQIQKSNHKKTGNIVSANFNSNYRIGKRDALSFNLIYLKSNSQTFLLPSFDEISTKLGIVHTF